MNMPAILYGLFFFWALSAVFDYAYYLYFIQLKEYRWDRFHTFLRTQQGRLFLFSFRTFFRPSIFIICYLFLNQHYPLQWLLLGYFLFDFANNAFLVYSKKIYRPQVTKKVLVIALITVLIEAGLIYFFWDKQSPVVLAIIFRLFIVGGVSLAISYASYVYRLYLKKKATQKILRLKDKQGLKVIAITGSYGKTSTKEILSQMLKNKFKVITIPRNLNTDYSISSFILQTDFSEAKMFIVEIGAYNEGDVKFACDIVLPDIGILTTVGPEHLSLFGSMEAIRRTKYELLHSLPENGLAVTTTDNDYIRPHLDTITAPVLTFGIDAEFEPKCLITHVKGKENGTSFKVKCNDTEYHLETKVVGEHNVKNIAPSMIVARHLGMNMDEILTAVQNLIPISRLLIKEYGKATILNDSYNSNPEGFKAALNLLSTYPTGKKRIVITRGMLELGDLSEELHEQIAGEISFAADKLVLINRDFEAPIRRGLVKKYGIELEVITDQKRLQAYIEQLKHENVVVLIENRLPPRIYSYLREHSSVKGQAHEFNKT